MRASHIVAGILAILAGGAWLGAADAGPQAKEEIYELPATGKNVAREKGGWINAEASGQRLVLKFFDPEKKPIPPDVVRGQAQFRYAGRNDARVPLEVEGMTLATPATVHPPHNYLVILAFFIDDSGQPSETLSFRYP